RGCGAGDRDDDDDVDDHEDDREDPHDREGDPGPLGELLRGRRLGVGLEVAEQAENAGDRATADEADDGGDEGVLLELLDVEARDGCGHGKPLLPDDRSRDAVVPPAPGRVFSYLRSWRGEYYRGPGCPPPWGALPMAGRRAPVPLRAQPRVTRCTSTVNSSSRPVSRARSRPPSRE